MRFIQNFHKFLSFMAIAVFAFALFGFQALAQEEEVKPKVCEEALQKSASSPGSSIAQVLRSTYPSCAAWLAKACQSSFRLDQETPLTKLLLNGDSVEGHPCLDCIRSGTDSVGRSANSISSLASHLKGAADPHLPKPHQAELVKVTLAHWQLVNQKRDQDLATILSFFDKEELPKTLRNAAVRGAIRTLGERVKAASQRAGDLERTSFQAFVADQIAEAGEDIPVEWVDENGVKQSDVYPGFYTRLKEEATDEDRFQELVRRAKKADNGDDYDFDGNLTPYHSKMILLYHLENSIRNKYESQPAKANAVLNELASKLHLKADFSGKGQGSQWEWVIPHDGFVLAANNSQINNLLKPSVSPSATNGTGVDCATYVHKMLLGSGYSELKKIGRMTSAGIATGGQLKNVATIERIKASTITKLGPGDLIVKRPKGDPVGHVEVVVGFEGDPPQIVTVSAAGGYQRTVVKRKHDLFPNQPHSCGEDNYFSESESNYYRATLKRGPK